ncbi:MAG: hypothetical protein HYY13_00420 [Nitrospirae bacterium]|nr:hypothetical protein [Nitrospirota bacterium]
MSVISPPSLVLDVLSVADPGAVPVRFLIRAASLFAITENATRVALSRLVAAGKIEGAPDGEPAAYGLSPSTRALNRYVRAACLEPPVRSWDGSWLQVLLTVPERERSSRRRMKDALTAVRLASPYRGVWMRPSNLALSADDLRRSLHELGVTSGMDVLLSRFQSRRRERELAAGLWQLKDVSMRLQGVLARLRGSLRALDAMPRERALAETFAFGGEVIRLLYHDPLLPQELLPSGWAGPEVRSLFGEYNGRGLALWGEFWLESCPTVPATVLRPLRGSSTRRLLAEAGVAHTLGAPPLAAGGSA